MAKKKNERKNQNQITFEGEKGRSKAVTESGRTRNRKPKYLRVHRKPDPYKPKLKRVRPNKLKRLALDREGNWHCRCGKWNVMELPTCEMCGLENPNITITEEDIEGETNDIRDNQSE